MKNKDDIFLRSEMEQREKVKDYYNTTNSSIVKDWGLTYQAAVIEFDQEMNLDERVRKSTLHFAKRAGIKSGNTILDAGCGAGGPAIVICEHFPNVLVHGITLSEEQGKTANKLIASKSLQERIYVHIGDFHSQPFPDEYFDVICFFESLEHAYNLKKVFSEAHRVLKENGLLYLKSTVRVEENLSIAQEKEIDILNEIYAMNLVKLSFIEKNLRVSGFSILESCDISGITNDSELFDRAIFGDNLTEGKLTDFGRQHAHKYEDLRVTRGEIKAQKQ